MKHLLIAMIMTLCFVSAASAGEVNLSIAASLKEVITELADGYARKTPGVRFLKNYAGSGTLAKQIENGSRADIFISANREWIDYLQGKQLLGAGKTADLAYNSLVFVAAADRKVFSLKDLTGLERIAIGSPKSVPAGEYAMEALRRAGVAPAVEKKLVMARDVRECLMYAERGEVDGAFVYRTDALAARRVAIRFSVPRDACRRVTYRMGLTISGTRNRDALAFYDYLQGREAKAVLTKYGFEVR